ncbi:MAG: hypothetical protein HFH91_17840 [Lachnospiraceae bacterium]|nr:hypothetical protein [Lachnospiraceae bacterium]
MKYRNAAEVLPERLLKEIQAYMEGEVLYIPRASERKEWGAENGSRSFYQERNREIRKLVKEGCSLESLSARYGLAQSTIKKIAYR